MRKSEAYFRARQLLPDLDGVLFDEVVDFLWSAGAEHGRQQADGIPFEVQERCYNVAKFAVPASNFTATMKSPGNYSDFQIRSETIEVQCEKLEGHTDGVHSAWVNGKEFAWPMSWSF